jgi:hypothetical protein
MWTSNTVVTCTLSIAAWALPGMLVAAPDGQMAPQTTGAPSDLQASRGTELAVTSLPDGIIVAADGPGVDVPWILSPLVRGSGGVQGVLTVLDQPEALVRLGAGWANARLTGTAPPFQFQEPPARRWNLDGTELAWRVDGGEFYASVQRRNWGPGWTGSLILDGAAQPLAAVGWRRPEPKPSTNPWLQWMGPWQADVFFGRLFGHDDPRLPALIGMRLQIQPFEPLQLGVSRTMQWGGKGRDESAMSLLHSLIGWDNVGQHGITAENQPGNQLGGFDARLQLGADRDDALYTQLIGEDQNNYMPSKYIVQAGLQVHGWVDRAELLGFVEWNDLTAGHAYNAQDPGVTYTSNVFKQGYTHDRMPLGYPAGGDVTLGSVGLLARMAPVRLAVVLSHGQALPTSQRFAAGPISGVNGSLQVDIEPRQQLGAALWWWRDSAERQCALQLWWRLHL